MASEKKDDQLLKIKGVGLKYNLLGYNSDVWLSGSIFTRHKNKIPILSSHNEQVGWTDLLESKKESWNISGNLNLEVEEARNLAALMSMGPYPMGLSIGARLLDVEWVFFKDTVYGEQARNLGIESGIIVIRGEAMEV